VAFRNPIKLGSDPVLVPAQYGQMVTQPAPLYTAPAQVPATYQPCR
jgi:hypothetical protein